MDQKGLFQSTPEEPTFSLLLYLSLSHRAQGSLSSPQSGCWSSLALDHDLGSWAQVLWAPVTESLLDFGIHTYSRSSWKLESCFRSCTGPPALRVLSAPPPQTVGLIWIKTESQVPDSLSCRISLGTGSYTEKVGRSHRLFFSEAQLH